jgi:acyl-coenzyme A synthetase/AMP-(fatty) acid ligase
MISRVDEAKSQCMVRGMSDSITASLHDWAKREPNRAALALGEKTWTVLKAGQTATAEELIAHCKAHLTGFKCPTAVDFPQALRTLTGKLLKRTLREPFWAGRTRQV